MNLPRSSLKTARFLYQGTYRTNPDTLSAKHTVRFIVGEVTVCYNLRGSSSVSVRNGVIDLNLVAGLNTPATEDAAGKIPDDKGVAGLSRVSGRAFWKSDDLHLISVGQLLKNTVTICLTGKAVMVTRGQKEFYIHLPGLYHPFRFCFNIHIVRSRCGTSRKEISSALNLNHADPAGPGRHRSLDMTEGRDINTVSLGNLKNGFTLFKRKPPSVDSNALFSIHSTPFPLLLFCGLSSGKSYI
ncbi:hypothetical protein ES703_116816 [subsurface metagenome]